jgi:hypothetical protein
VPLVPGYYDLVADRCRLAGILGVGGLAEVRRAWDTVLRLRPRADPVPPDVPAIAVPSGSVESNDSPATAQKDAPKNKGGKRKPDS